MKRLRELGIEVAPNLESATTWDYELLYIPKEKAEICKLSLEADIRRAQLPSRILVGGIESGNCKVCASTKQKISKPGDEKAILTIYDEWLKFLLGRRRLNKVSLSIFFEGLEKSGENWKDFPNKNKPCYVSKILSRTGAADKMIRKDYPAKTITLWRHITLGEFWKKVINQRTKRTKHIIYYQECTYGDPFFAYLSSVNPKDSMSQVRFQAQYFLRQIIEATLSRVVIIDERIANIVAAKSMTVKSSDNDDNKNKAINKSLAHKLAWMGIWIVGKLIFENGGICHGINIVENFPAPGLVTLKLSYEERKFSIKIENPQNDIAFPKEPPKIEILTVHQTILDGKFEEPLKKILGKEDWKEHWALALKPNVLFVYSHSGRGHPKERLPKNTPFIEYSFLQTHILNQPSKFFFTQIALTSKEKREK